MGVHYPIQAGGIVYTVVDDLLSSYVALITGALVDEVSGTPLQVSAVITPDLPGLIVNFGGGALFAVAGYVDQAFPKLATTPYTVTLEIVAAGYRPASVTANVPIGATFPVELPPIKLRPLPVRLQGRVVKQSDRSGIAGATVASGAATVLLMRSPVYFDHVAGVTINAFSFTPVGPARSLAAAVKGGSATLFLNSSAGLGATQTLQIGSDPLAELAVIQTLGPGTGQVNLQTSLNSSFPNNVPVQQVTPAALGPSATLARSSNAGDGLVILSAGLAASAIQVSDGASTEYHLLNAITDSSGYYHFNGLAGVQSLNLQASAGGFTTGSATWFLVYNDPVNVVDFRLKP
jgi:hypothetical protein